MKGLIRKDFYLLWSYCRLMPLFLLAFIIFSAFSSDGQSPFFIYYPCILSSVLPVNLLAYDDAEHWLTYCDTLPVTRRQYVSGKYIMSLICAGTIFLLSAVAAVIRLCRNGAFCPADLTDQLAVLATISLLSSALVMAADLQIRRAEGTHCFHRRYWHFLRSRRHSGHAGLVRSIPPHWAAADSGNGHFRRLLAALHPVL